MSNVVKKCTKDGIVYDVTFTGNCASCFGPLKYFCKTHNEWLADANCPKCAGQPTASPAQPTTSGPSIVGVLAVLAICVGVFVACGWFVYRIVILKPKPAPVAVTAPKPRPPTAPAAPAVYTLTLSQLLADPDQYVGKQVTISGSIQFRDASRETIDLHDGTRIITVQYRGLPAATKTVIAGTGADRRLSVTGTLQRDDADNSYYVVARSVEVP